MNRITRMIGAVSCCLAVAALPILCPAQSIRRLSVMPASLVGGTTANGSVTLNRKAPSGGYVVTLTSSESYVTTPASVTVAAGSTAATFTVSSSSVAARSNAAITATGQDGKAQTENLKVLPVQLVGLGLSPQSVTGGVSSTATLTLDGPAPTGGLSVSILSNEAFAQVPPTVTIPAGQSSTTFTVTTSTVTSNGNAVLIATDTTGSHAIDVLRVTAPVVVKVQNIQVLPGAVIAGETSTGIVNLNGSAPSGGFVVTLASNQTFLTVPTSVTFAAGQKSATFTISTSEVTKRSSAKITATDPNGKTANAEVDVAPLQVLIVYMLPPVVNGGSTTSGVIMLNGEAPSGGFTLSLSSNQPFVTVPSSVTVSAGTKSVTFSVSTTAVTSKHATAKITVTDPNGKTTTTEVVVLS